MSKNISDSRIIQSPQKCVEKASPLVMKVKWIQTQIRIAMMSLVLVKSEMVVFLCLALHWFPFKTIWTTYILTTITCMFCAPYKQDVYKKKAFKCNSHVKFDRCFMIYEVKRNHFKGKKSWCGNVLCMVHN